MNNYNFEKRIYKNGINYCIEISLPNDFNSFFYKIYGNEGFYNYGKYSSYKNNDVNNTLLININKVQLLFISLIESKKNKEYYDFVDMNNHLENPDLLKNIKIKIERQEDNFQVIENIIDDISSSSSEEDSDSSSSDDELSDEEIDLNVDKQNIDVNV